MSITQVAVVQMTSTPEVAPNLEAAGRLVARAAEQGAKLVVLPEGFAYLGPDGGQRAVAERLDGNGPILSRCREWAQKSNVELVLGGFWEKGDSANKVKNACVHLDAKGEVRAIYRKIHMFDVDLPDGTVLRESDTVEPGKEIVATDTSFGKLGLSVCYDLRFPELYRGLVDRGAIALAIPAAFTLTTGKDHWHVLLRARAIEAQSYVLAAAQTGHHYGKRNSYGHALICDPWGTIVAECADGEGVAVAWIEPERVDKARAALPSLKHRVLGQN
jgi:predicted amidohydrolase